MKIFYKLSFAILILFFTSLINSCKKNQLSEINTNSISVEITKKNHAWYYFTNTTFKQIERPQDTPSQPQKPWTESIRISSANNIAETNEDNAAYAVVNRLGVLKFDNDAVFLSPDVTIFSDRTADNLVFVNNTPVFSVYKSSFFNDSARDSEYTKNDSSHLFLIQFNPIAKISYPILNCNNITKNPNSEITDFYWNGFEWCCSIKTISDTKNDFSYVNFKPLVSLLTLSPSTAGDSLAVSETDVKTFRKTRAHIEYKNAPERIKKLLAGFDTKLPFIIEVKNAGGSSPRIYENTVQVNAGKELNAKAILSQSWSAALFEDGTLFLEGALPGRHILRSGMPVAIRLPKLPTGFVYSDFVISGTTLYAAWEESSFYKTGRSGFLQVNLDRTLYSRLI